MTSHHTADNNPSAPPSRAPSPTVSIFDPEEQGFRGTPNTSAATSRTASDAGSDEEEESRAVHRLFNGGEPFHRSVPTHNPGLQTARVLTPGEQLAQWAERRGSNRGDSSTVSFEQQYLTRPI